MDKKVYRSSIGLMYSLVAILLAAIIAGSFLYIRGDGNMIAISVAYVIAVIAYYFAIVYPVINTKYILEKDRLEIRCGIYKNEISFQQILDVYKKDSLGRHPALSEKMVFIKYRDCSVTNIVGISPKNRDEVIHELQKVIKE